MVDKNDWVDIDKVYAIRRKGEDHATELALYVNPAYHGFNGICYLTAGDRGHMIEGYLDKKTDTGFTFVSEGYAEGVWEFIEVNYENFKNEYCKIVISGENILKEISDTQELTDWYHHNFPKR